MRFCSFDQKPDEPVSTLWVDRTMLVLERDGYDHNSDWNVFARVIASTWIPGKWVVIAYKPLRNMMLDYFDSPEAALDAIKRNR